MKRSFKIIALAGALSAAFASQVQAGGFQLTEQSALGLGRSFAGIAVENKDASIAWYNPAAMTQVGGTQVQLGAVGIGMNLDYVGKALDENNQPYTFAENGRKKPAIVPHAYVTHQLNDKTWLGLSVAVPYGMAIEYSEDMAFPHNAHGISSELMSVDINPSIAYKLTDTLSVAAGASVQYVQANLRLYSYTNQNLKPGDQWVGKPDGMTNSQNGENYAPAEFDAHSTKFGYNLGMMWEPTEDIRVGASYRSKIDHTAKGTLTVADAKVIPALTNIEGPAWAMLSAAWDVNEKVSLYTTFRWTDWSSFETLTIEDSASGTPVKQIKNNWRDTYLGSFGMDWKVNSFWTLRGGIAYERSPITDPSLRTTIIPDADRWWFSGGSTFNFSKAFQVDVAFAHLHGVHERSIYQSEGSSTEIGRFRKLDAFLVGVQGVYRF